MNEKSNKPAAPNAGIASQLAIGHHWPGVGEPGRSAKMTAIPVKIVRFADDSQPGWVECEFYDAADRRHAFIEKIPVVTKDELWRDSVFPRDGIIACEVVSSWVDENGRSLTKVDTSRPWDVESKEGIAEFVVFAATLWNID